MKILIKPNFDKPGSLACTRDTLKMLGGLGFAPMLDESVANAVELEEGCAAGPLEELLPQCDLLLTIGGDGTILHAVQKAVRIGKPLLGINTGRIGFLTQIEADELHHLRLLKEGKYGYLRRMMLEVTLFQDGREETFAALNDVVFTRGASDRLVEIDIRCQDNPVAAHRADGVIFCTPTGSTAYNLAAGGAIADPRLDLILLTAICPHSHFNHTLLLSPENEFEVREVPGNNKTGLVLTVDGERAGVMRLGAHAVIKRSARRAEFIDFGLRDFYNCINKKLRIRK